MAVNLVDAVSEILAPRVVAALARAVGLNEAVAQRLATATIPTILAALTTMAAAPGGARRVSEAVSNADPDILSKVAAGDADVMTQGTGLLSRLLGGSGLSSLVAALSQYSGAPQPAAQSVAGAVAEAAIGAIAQQDPSNWSDGPAIAPFLNGQKADIAAALPPEIERALAPTGIVAGLGAIGAARPPKPPSAAVVGAASVAAAQARVARPPKPPSAAVVGAASVAAAQARAAPPRRPSGFPTWAVVVLVVVVIIALAAIWWFLAESYRPAPVPPPVKQGLLPAPFKYALVAPPKFRC